MAANTGLEKRLRRAIALLEGSSPVRASITSPKRSKNPLSDACSDVRQLLVDEEFWPRGDTSRAVTALFDSMDREDASFRIQCEQTIHAIFRKFALKGHPSRVVAALLNELSRQRSSARGHVLALGLLGAALSNAAERRIGLYVAHFFHALRESLRRPEQSIQTAVEAVVPPIIASIRWDIAQQSHSGYVAGVVAAAVENLALSGAPNRAAAAVLAAVAANIPEFLSDVIGKMSDILLVAEEATNRPQLLGVLHTLKRLWPTLAASDHEIPCERIQMLICRCLCCLKSPTNSIQIAALELLERIAADSGDELLDFCPAKLLAPTDGWSAGGDAPYSPTYLNATLESIGLTPLDRDDDDAERGRLSRLNSVASTPLTSRAPSIVDDDEELSLSLDESTDSIDEDFCSSPPASPPAPIELDARFSLIDPLGAVAESGDESESRSATPTPEEHSDEPPSGPLCLEFPPMYSNSPSDALELMAEWITAKFLRRADGSLREDAEIRVALKILALKVLTAIGRRRSLNSGVLADLSALARHSDDAVVMAELSLLANVELRAVEQRKSVGEPRKCVAISAKFLHLIGDALRRATPLRLKELHQLLADCSPLLGYSPPLLAAVLDSAIRSRDCDYFLLKSVRSHLIGQIEWSRVEAAMLVEYQDRAIGLVCTQLHDEDPRVVAAAAAALPEIVKRAQLGDVTNLFLVRWPERLYGAAFPAQSQVFGLHPAYAAGDSPDPLIEQNLDSIIQRLQRDYLQNPLQRLGGFVAALSALAADFPPNSYGHSWRIENPKESLLPLLLDALDSGASSLTQLCQLLRLCGQLFAGIAECAFIRSANRAESTAQFQPLPDDPTLLRRLLCAPVRLLNLYYSLIREHTNRQRRAASAAGSALNAFSRLVGSATASDERKRGERLAGWSQLNATGIQPMPGGGFAESASLIRLEPLLRAALLGFTTSLRSDAANRCAAPLEAAAFALTALIEFLPPSLLWPHADELLLYTRATMFISMRAATRLMTALIRALFRRTAAHQRADAVGAQRLRSAVASSDLLDMLVGRSINNYSVHTAFLDRADFMDLHQSRHIGWLSAGVFDSTRSAAHSVEIAERLATFERTVGQLLRAFVGSGDVELRLDILRLVGVLLLNDVRYDRLDPHGRLWSAVVVAIRHPTGKHSPQWAELFRFALTVARGSDTPNFGDVFTLLVELVDRWMVERPDGVMAALHEVLLEAIHHRADVPNSLVGLLRREELFVCRPAECIQLWTMLLHWLRSRPPGSAYLDLSAEFTAMVFDLMGCGKMLCSALVNHCKPFILDSSGENTDSAMSSPLKIVKNSVNLGKSEPLSRLESNSPAEEANSSRMVVEKKTAAGRDDEFSSEHLDTFNPETRRSSDVGLSEGTSVSDVVGFNAAFNVENAQPPADDLSRQPSFIPNISQRPEADAEPPNPQPGPNPEPVAQTFNGEAADESTEPQNLEIPAEADRLLQTPVPPSPTPHSPLVPPDPRPSASTPTSPDTTPTAQQHRPAPIPIHRLFQTAHSLSVAIKTADPRVFRPIDSLFQVYKETHENVFAAIPLAIALICRRDQPTLALQLAPLTAPEDPLEWLGGSLARTFAHSLRHLASAFRSQSPDSALLEDAAAFHAILILHAIRSELSRSRRLVAAFRCEIDNQLNGTELGTALWKGAFLFPKPVAIWLAVAVEMELDPLRTGEWFARTDWTFPIQQLLAALYLQKLCESPQPSPALLRGLNWSSDELCGIILKAARPKQLTHLGAHLPVEEFESFIGKLKHNLCAHRDHSVYPALITILRSNANPTQQIGQLLRCLDSTPEAVHPQLIDAFIHDRCPTEWTESHFSDGFPVSQKCEKSLRILIGLIEEIDQVDGFEAVAGMAVRMDASVVGWLLERVRQWQRPHLIAALFVALGDGIAAEQRRAHVHSRDANHFPNYAIAAQMVSLISESEWLSAEDCRRILVELGRRSFAELSPFSGIRIDGEFFKLLDRLFLDELHSAKSNHRPIESWEFYSALSEFINRSLPERCRRDEYFAVERMAPLLMLAVEDLERRLPATDRLKPTAANWQIELVAESEVAERLRDEIIGSVFVAQRAAHCLIDCRYLFDSALLNSAESALSAILRIPTFARMFSAPRVAISRNWPLRMVGAADRLHIPLVGIGHLTGDLEILEDFARRCLLLGWTRRVEFEERWMSLFGVLAATRLGAEALSGEDPQLTEQTATSCAAIRTIAAMIAQSALRPMAGDPTKSRYVSVVESTMDLTFRKSRFGCWASEANAQIAATFPLDPTLRFDANDSAKSSPTDPFYPLGHFSLRQLRNRLVDSPRSPTRNLTAIERLSPVESTDLDIRSAVRALFDNFFHWTAVGWKEMPSELIAATVQAVAYLSDFVQDTPTLSRLFSDLRKLPTDQLGAETKGLLNYTALKVAATIGSDGVELSASAFAKQIHSFVSLGLCAESVETRDSTLRGILYLMAAEEWNALSVGVEAMIGQFVMEELQRLNSNRAEEAKPLNYHRLLWRVGFELILSNTSNAPDFPSAFIAFTQRRLIEPRFPLELKISVAFGVERLVLKDSAYCGVFRDSVIELIDTHQLQPSHLPLAVALYSTILYRAAAQTDGNLGENTESFREEFQKLLNVFTSPQPSAVLTQLLEPIARLLCRLLPASTAIQTLIQIILPPAPSTFSPTRVKPADPIASLTPYDFCLHRLLYYSLKCLLDLNPKETRRIVGEELLPTVDKCEFKGLAAHINGIVKATMAEEAETKGLLQTLLRSETPSSSAYPEIIQHLHNLQFLP